MANEQQRHDMSDEVWNLLKPHLPGNAVSGAGLQKINAFLHLKRWRGIATRYAKNTASFLAAVQIRCIAIWCTILT